MKITSSNKKPVIGIAIMSLSLKANRQSLVLIVYIVMWWGGWVLGRDDTGRRQQQPCPLPTNFNDQVAWSRTMKYPGTTIQHI